MQSEHRAAMKPEVFVCQGTMAYCVQAGHYNRNTANFLDRDKITLHSHTHTYIHTLQRCAKVSWLVWSVCWLTSQWPVYRFTLRHDEAASLWHYLRVAEWMFAFRHLLGPSALDIKSCQVSFYTATCVSRLKERQKNVIACASVQTVRSIHEGRGI